MRSIFSNLVSKYLKKHFQKSNSTNDLATQRGVSAPKGQCAGDFNFSATKKTLGGLSRFGNSNVKRFVSPVRSNKRQVEPPFRHAYK